MFRKLEIPPSEFCPIYGDWSKLGIPNLARMLQNARVTAFIVSELLRENQQGGEGEVKLPLPPSPPILGLTQKNASTYMFHFKINRMTLCSSQKRY